LGLGRAGASTMGRDQGPCRGQEGWARAKGRNGTMCQDHGSDQGLRTFLEHWGGLGVGAFILALICCNDSHRRISLVGLGAFRPTATDPKGPAARPPPPAPPAGGYKKMIEKMSKHIFLKMSEINFPGLGTLR